MLLTVWTLTIVISSIIITLTHKYGEINETSISNHSVELIKWESQFETKWKTGVAA